MAFLWNKTVFHSKLPVVASSPKSGAVDGSSVRRAHPDIGYDANSEIRIQALISQSQTQDGTMSTATTSMLLIIDCPYSKNPLSKKQELKSTIWGSIVAHANAHAVSQKIAETNLLNTKHKAYGLRVLQHFREDGGHEH